MPTLEERVGRLVANSLREQGLTARQADRRLEFPSRTVERLVAGRERLDLEVLSRVLVIVGVTPDVFFARLFATGVGAAGVASKEVPSRRQLAALIEWVRVALEEIRLADSDPPQNPP